MNDILNYFEELYPDAHCELNYTNDYELLINIILSAQTTDKKVNEITKELFKTYKTPNDLSNAKYEDIVHIINPLGLAKNKSRQIISCCKSIVDVFDNKIPSTHDKLLTLDGVGNKTANVFLAVYHNIPTFAVDTHVKRVANRLNLSKSDNVDLIEKDLKNIFPKEMWIDLHHRMIFFGRYHCTSKKPKCENCKLTKKCNSFYK